MPTIRPTIAPKHKLGINNPHGTFIPNVKIVVISLKINARTRSDTAVNTPGPADEISSAVVMFLLYT